MISGQQARTLQALCSFFAFRTHVCKIKGINYIDVVNYTEKDIARIQSAIEKDRAKSNFDMVVVSLHWGTAFFHILLSSVSVLKTGVDIC